MEKPGRREVIFLLGSTAATTLIGCAGEAAPLFSSSETAATSCIVTPDQTEGPYFVEERLNRSDIRVDPSTGAVKAGVPLSLTLRLSKMSAGACTPLAGTVVDVWHCDASGMYSDVRDSRFNEAITDAVPAKAPYNTKGRRNTLNGADGIFRDGGRQLTLPLVAQGGGYGATFDIGVRI